MAIPSKKRRGRPPTRTEPGPEIMTIPEVAEYLLCHPTTIYRLLAEHQIPGFQLGSDWRFQRSAIAQWIRDQQMKPIGRPRKVKL
jgi:excisionase family DNA binding protein